MATKSPEVNQIITNALNTSPYARATHDKVFPTGFYSYAVCPKKSDGQFTRLAGVQEIGATGKVQLFFDPELPPEQCNTDIHHELCHIDQWYNIKTLGYTTSELSYSSIDTAIVINIIKEVQARVLQVEGAFLHYSALKGKKKSFLNNIHELFLKIKKSRL